MRLQDKVIIVTGAAAGQGRAQVLRCVEEGAVVVATDINILELEKLETELGQSAQGFTTMIHDVSKWIDWERIIEETIALYGRIDVLINNAGAMGKEESFQETTLEEFHHVMDTNVWGTYLGMRAVIEQMKLQQTGNIINVAAQLGKSRTLRPYEAAKGALQSMTKAAAAEFSSANVQVNAVFPALDESDVKHIDSVAAVIYLASEESAGVNGTEILMGNN